MLVIAKLCLRRGQRKTPGKDARAGIPWVESKRKLTAQSPIVSLPNRLNTCFIHSSLHKQARDNSKVTLVTQFSIFSAIARFRKISVYVTGPEKTGLIYTKYTHPYYGIYLFFCVCYPNSVSFIEILKIVCI